VNKKRDEQLAKLLRKKRWNKNDVERIRRFFAEIESEARSQSEKRQERIKLLWDLDEQQLKGAKKPQDIEQQLKKQKLKKLLNCIKDLADNNALADQVGELVDLVELAGLQDREIKYLAPFRRELERIRDYDPKQLENLSTASAIAELLAELQPGFEKQPAEEKPKKAWERKRSRLHLDFRNSIEYQFGGGAEVEWRKQTQQFPPALWPDHPIYKAPPPTCLDEMFAGDGVSMLKLEELFWMERHRFPKDLPSRREGRKEVHDWQAVEQIMDSLLNEEPRKRKTSGRGRLPRMPWLNDPKDPDLRNRVLKGIEARLNSLSVPEQIKPRMKARFLKVIHRHLPDSGKK
jgi:hypothetical protein